ncbi:MAG: N-acetylneuraminate synthase family protein [Patescibacteria group bacterium]
MREIKIGNKKVGGNNPAYIIAEIGLNHQGDVGLAKRLIDYAIEAGVDAVKFQKRSLKDGYRSGTLENIEKEEHGGHYLLQHIQKSELSNRDMKKLRDYSLSRGVDFLCTPWDETSLKFLSSMNLPAYKIASADMVNFRLIHEASKLKKPLIISTGMSFMSEIESLVDFLEKIKVEYVLLHCNGTYPAPYHDINLKFIEAMRAKFNCNVGYSGHEQGIAVSLAAVSMGAKLIEKHLTLDRNMPGPDHKASLEPGEFCELVKQIRNVESAMGEPVRYPSRGEFLNREILSKSIVAVRNLKKGSVLKYSDVELRSPGKGTNPLKLNFFIGKKLIKRDVPKHDYLLESDIDLMSGELHSQILRGLPIKHRWGLVARMSDIDTLLHHKPSFVEIHLTDSDINQNKTYSAKYDYDLTVHGPEYNGDLLLNLSSLDENIRQKSIDFFNKALAHARELKKLFRNRNKIVKFVVHPGGMNMESALLDKIPELNKNLLRSLKKLKSQGFELLPENMPGLAWYFGGQWHQASFMDADEIVKFSKKTGYGITFDTSHAALYCNLYGKNLEEYTKKILPVVKYIHISDGAKFNGEGLQIGDGSIDFKRILAHLVKSDLWFLPEIWQGHKFGGESFIKAIKNLKSIDSNF